MKQRSLKVLIKKALNELEWPRLEQQHEAPNIRIASYPKSKSHVILMPEPDKNESTDLDYLHEVGHATLCERVHPVFAANILYAPLMRKREFLPVVPALTSAADWFVGHWQYELAPELARKQLQQTLPLAEEMLAAQELPPLEIILACSMVVAQAVHYLDEPIDCGGVLKSAVDAFLAAPPEQPSLDACAALTNRLLETYAEERVRFNDAGELSAWEVLRPEAAAPAPSTAAQG